MWRVGVRAADGTADVLPARFVISAVGSLNLPRLPEIPGMDTFAGPSFHSARWPEDLDIAGTRFALVGAGASGFQIGPAIADEVEQLTIFQRTAQWILPNRLYHTPVPDGDAWALRHLPFYGRWYRFVMTFAGIAAGMEMYRIDPEYEDPTHQSINALNAKRATGCWPPCAPSSVTIPTCSRRSSPTIRRRASAFCRTTAPGCAPSSGRTWSWSGPAIERVVPDGIVTTDGVHYPADVICYATGFRHNEFLASMKVIGRHGTSLHDQWGDEPTAYLGITMPNFPNLFCIYGPGTNLAFGASLFYHSEFQVHYALEAIRETLASGAWSQRGAQRRARRLRRPLPGGDRPAGVVAPRHHAQPLQEQRGQGLHAVPVAARPVLGVDPAHGRATTTCSTARDGGAGGHASCTVGRVLQVAPAAFPVRGRAAAACRASRWDPGAWPR